MKGTGMRKQIIWGIGFILCTAAFCTACGKSQKISIQDPYTIGVVTKSSTSEYWMSLCEGVKEAADQYNMNVIILQPDSETNKEAQIKMMETLAKEPDMTLAYVESGYSNLQLREEVIDRLRQDLMAINLVPF